RCDRAERRQTGPQRDHPVHGIGCDAGGARGARANRRRRGWGDVGELPRREGQMPAVAALPQPDVKERGWEAYGGGMDAQMRNAIYGYLADSEKQTKAGYMREVVMPGMARLLRRPAYDF